MSKDMRPRVSGVVCGVCGFVYDPALGLPNEGIPPGTPFENIPDDWGCPDCGASKADFQPEEG